MSLRIKQSTTDHAVAVRGALDVVASRVDGVVDREAGGVVWRGQPSYCSDDAQIWWSRPPSRTLPSWSMRSRSSTSQSWAISAAETLWSHVERRAEGDDPEQLVRHPESPDGPEATALGVAKSDVASDACLLS